MSSNGTARDVDQLLVTLETMPLDELEIVQWFATALVEHPDDKDHRKEMLSKAIARMSALHSV